MDPTKPLSDLLDTQAEFPELTDDDRRMLAEMCQPGRPLWKILKAGLDHARAIGNDIAAIPLVGGPNIEAARQLQLQMEAALKFTKWVAQATQANPGAIHPGKEQSNG